MEIIFYYEDQNLVSKRLIRFRNYLCTLIGDIIILSTEIVCVLCDVREKCASEGLVTADFETVQLWLICII